MEINIIISNFLMKNLKEDKVLVKGHVARAWLIVTGQDPSAKPGHFPAGLSSLFQGPDLPLDLRNYLKPLLEVSLCNILVLRPFGRGIST